MRSLAMMVIGEYRPRTSNTFPKVEAMVLLVTLSGMFAGVATCRESVETFQWIPKSLREDSGGPSGDLPSR